MFLLLGSPQKKLEAQRCMFCFCMWTFFSNQYWWIFFSMFLINYLLYANRFFMALTVSKMHWGKHPNVWFLFKAWFFSLDSLWNILLAWKNASMIFEIFWDKRVTWSQRGQTPKMITFFYFKSNFHPVFFSVEIPMWSMSTDLV